MFHLVEVHFVVCELLIKCQNGVDNFVICDIFVLYQLFYICDLKLTFSFDLINVLKLHSLNTGMSEYQSGKSVIWWNTLLSCS